jgi:hypothetical protein
MNKNRRKKHSPVPVSSLFGKLLPDNFQQKSATIQQYQQFFYSRTGDAIYQMVEVMNVTDSTLTLAVPSPGLVNYLRLHSLDLRQQISEQFGVLLELKIVAQPGSLEPDDQRNALKPARHFSRDVCEKLRKSASSVDDEALRAALISLSRAIKDEQ